jgi:hypothetical protein
VKEKPISHSLIGSVIPLTTEFFSRKGRDPIKPNWFVTFREKTANWTEHNDVIRTCVSILDEREVPDDENKSSWKNEMLEKVGKKGLGLLNAHLSFTTMAFALHLQDAIFVKTGARSAMKISADLFLHHSEAIIGLQKGNNDSPSWTTKIGEFEAIIREEDILCCTRSSIWYCIVGLLGKRYPWYIRS